MISKKKVFVDISVRASAPNVGVAISSGYANKTDKDGNPQFLSEVFLTSDSGKDVDEKRRVARSVVAARNRGFFRVQ